MPTCSSPDAASGSSSGRDRTGCPVLTVLKGRASRRAPGRALAPHAAVGQAPGEVSSPPTPGASRPEPLSQPTMVNRDEAGAGAWSGSRRPGRPAGSRRAHRGDVRSCPAQRSGSATPALARWQSRSARSAVACPPPAPPSRRHAHGHLGAIAVDESVAGIAPWQHPGPGGPHRLLTARGDDAEVAGTRPTRDVVGTAGGRGPVGRCRSGHRRARRQRRRASRRGSRRRSLQQGERSGSRVHCDR